jgi:hypothetical protein
MTMELERKQDTSIYIWLKSLFTDAPFINIVDGWPEGELNLPTIALEYDKITPTPFEMGNKINNRTRTWYIDIFAVNKSQRDEIGFRILNALETKIPVYDYDQGIPPTYSGPWSVLGYLDPENVTLRNIKLFPELNEVMYYRAAVDFSADYLRDNSGGFS